MKKIGLLGGTFNPIHNGHLLLAQTALEQCDLDEMWILPSGISYMKKGMAIPDGETRGKMAELAIEGLERFHVCDLEIKTEGNTYTANTLIELRRIYPDHWFYFIIGGDSLAALPSWYHPEMIMENCTLVVGQRDADDDQKIRELGDNVIIRFGGKIIYLKFPDTPISSSEIRKKLQFGESVDGLVPAGVLSYIREHHMYEDVE